MIKVSVMYPAGDGITFDVDYYADTHMEIVNRTMKPSKTSIDKQIDGPYIAVGHLYYDSMDALAAGMGDTDEAMGDIANFTNATPVMQISEVVAD